MLYSSTRKGLVACTLTLLAAAASAQAPLPKDFLPIAGTAAPREAQVNPAAAPAPTKTLHLTFALTFPRKAELEALIASQNDPKSPDFHRWLTPQQVGQRFGATDADLQAVVGYAKSQGFNVTHVWPNRLFVSADATVAQAERAFSVHIGGYNRPAIIVRKDDPPTFYAPDHDPQAPAALAGRLQGIYGLSSLLRMHPSLQGNPAAAGSRPGSATPGTIGSQSKVYHPMTGNGTLGYGPAQISAFYNLDGLHSAGLNGDGMFIGIFSPTLVDFNDVAYFTSAYGITGYQLYQEFIDGGPTDANGADEANLDMDVILGQGNHANVVLYEPPNGDSAPLNAWLAMQTDDLPVISDSWGFDETDLVGFSDFVNAFDSILAAMAAQGQAIYNASGDTGAYNRAYTALSVPFPASDTHVTAVGGTSIPGVAAWSAEQGWSFDGRSGSGGGLSRFFARPAWQAGPGVLNGFSNGMRQVPDIASLADPNNPGYWVFTGGQWQVYGGTSAAAPLWSAANLLIDQGAGVSFGNLNPALYWLGTNLNDATDVFVFHDSTVGNDGYYSCTPDWDFVTGWGSANCYKLYVDLLMAYNLSVHPELRPDLLPYNPGSGAPGGNWTSPIMIHTAQGDVTEPGAFNNTTPYYFAAAVLNNGAADAPANGQSLRIDGVDHPFTQGAFPSGYYYYTLQAYSTTLSAGTHTIQLIANANNTVPESNTGNNVFTRTITVGQTTTNTYITVANVTGAVGQTVAFSAVLRRASDNAVLPNKTVTVFVGYTNLGNAVTDSTGTAHFSYKIPDTVVSGTQTITFKRFTDAQYNGSQATGTLTVTPANIYFSVANVSAARGQMVTLSAVFYLASDNTALPHKTVSVGVDGVHIGNTVTDGTGTAHFSYTIPTTMSVGKHTIIFTRFTDAQFHAGQGTGTLTVTN